jgi:hypothetical protein
MCKKVFVLTAAFVITLTVLSGCIVSGGRTVTGRGSMTTYEIDVTGFTGVDIGGAYSLTFRQSPTFSVTLEIQENLFRHVNTSVRGGMLFIDSNRTFNTTAGNTPRLVITAPDLNELNVSGAVNANIHTDANRLAIDVSGAANLNLSGSAHRLDITATGAANVNAFDMHAVNASINLAGAGNADMYASETLDVTVSGVGRVRYDGDARVTRNVMGLGSVTRRN